MIAGSGRRLAVLVVLIALLIAGGGTERHGIAGATEPVAGEAGVNASIAAIASASTAGTVALGVYQPVFPNDLSAVDAYEAAASGKVGIVHWYALWGGWKREFSRADLEVVAARGSLPMITWEPWAGVGNDPAWTLRETVLSGRNDAYIASWAEGLAGYGRPVLLRFAHEMHHQTYPWALGVNGNTADEYVAAWRHVRAIFDRAGATNVEWVWNPNTLGDAPTSAYLPLYRSLYPGDAYVDWVGLDIYNTGPNLDWGAPYWRSFDRALRPPYEALGALTAKPVILPEVGSAETGGSKSAWIADALSESLVADFPRVKAVVWFDINKEERWSLQSSPASFEAFATAAARPVFRAAGLPFETTAPAAFVPLLRRG